MSPGGNGMYHYYSTAAGTSMAGLGGVSGIDMGGIASQQLLNVQYGRLLDVCPEEFSTPNLSASNLLLLVEEEEA